MNKIVAAVIAVILVAEVDSAAFVASGRKVAGVRSITSGRTTLYGRKKKNKKSGGGGGGGGAGTEATTADSSGLVAIELNPEPEGGTELTAVSTLGDGCRMKEMGVVEDDPAKKQTAASEEIGPVHKFWMTAIAEGALTKGIRAQILKDASKKANFPGFRQGQVPPYAQPQITQFAVQESLIKTVEAAVEAFGLKSLPGSSGEVEIFEDVAAISNVYKTGNSIQFTATLNASYDPEKESESTDDVVDVEVETVAAESE